VSTRYEQRLDEGNLRNYGRLVVELATAVPDGLVVFFVSYSYMDYVIARWHEDGILADLMEHKLIFIETQVCRVRGVCGCTVKVNAGGLFSVRLTPSAKPASVGRAAHLCDLPAAGLADGFALLPVQHLHTAVHLLQFLFVLISHSSALHRTPV
jgi:hypothetical protein